MYLACDMFAVLLFTVVPVVGVFNSAVKHSDHQ